MSLGWNETCGALGKHTGYSVVGNVEKSLSAMLGKTPHIPSLGKQSPVVIKGQKSPLEDPKQGSLPIWYHKASDKTKDEH